jgi:sugar phosphate isomerase/epimerase
VPQDHNRPELDKQEFPMPPIALQLYSVREALTQAFAATVRQVAAIGYAGVEPYAFPGTTPEAAGQLFGELGLVVPSCHSPMPLGEKKNEVLETMAAIDCRRIVSGLGPDQFKTADLVRAACDRFNEAHAVAADNGLSFGIHNHWWEFESLDGRLVFELMLELLHPDIFFQIDTYWVKTAGPDPADIVHRLGRRAPLLHVKDGPAIKDAPMVAVGQGSLDFRSIVTAGEGNIQWLIVELDHCATDMMTAVADSYDYLAHEGLGHGR